MKTATRSESKIEELLVHGLKDIYNAEKQLLKALPKMARAATSEKLRTAFEDHLAETEGQVERLEQVFEALGVAARGVKCAAMEGLVEEGKEVLEDEDFEGAVKDAALIGAANKVEHYEIASYGTLASYARLLGNKKAVKLLEATLKEEKAADELLTELAETEINLQADEMEEE